jgi:hypothetical protein
MSLYGKYWPKSVNVILDTPFKDLNPLSFGGEAHVCKLGGAEFRGIR